MNMKINNATPAFQSKFMNTLNAKLKGGKDLTIRYGEKDIEYMVSKNKKMVDGSGFHNPQGFNVLEILNIAEQFKSMAKDGKKFMAEFVNALMKKSR